MTDNRKKHQDVSKNLKRTRKELSKLEQDKSDLELRCKELDNKATGYALICKINEAVNQGITQSDLFNMVTKETKKIFSSDGATFYLLSKDKHYLVLQQNPYVKRLINQIKKTFYEKIPSELRIIIKKDSLYYRILMQKKPIILNDTKSIQKLMSEFTESKVLKSIIPKVHKLLKKRSIMIAPLVSDDEIIGLIDISRDKIFEQSDLERFKAISEQLTMIIQQYTAHLEKEKAEDLFKQFVNAANEGFILYNAALNVIDVNDYMLEKFNLKKSDVVGTNIADLLIDTWESGRYDEYKKVIDTGVPYIIEDVITTSDFGNRHLTIKAFKVGDGLGMIIQDMTDQKRIEKALSDSKQRYRAIVNDQTELICRFTPDKKLTFVNSAYCKYFKRKREQLIGMNFMELIHEKDRKYVAEKIAELNKENTVGVLEERVVLPDGRIKWQQWINRVFLDEKGNISEFQSVGRDITERKTAEEKLKESEDKYRQLVEQSLQGIVVIQDFRIVYANTAFCNISGYSADELGALKRQQVQALIHPDDQTFVWSRFKARLAGKKVEPRYEYRGLRKDGSIIWLEMRAARIEFQGRPAIQGAVNDISERKKILDQLKLSLKEKEALLREIHHRVKNNLQIVSSLLNLQTRCIDNEDYQRFFRESQNRIKSMVLVHEKLYQTADLANIKPSDYLSSLLQQLFNAYNISPGSIILKGNIADFPMIIDIAIPCGLLVNELVSNSLKHAFPGLIGYSAEDIKKTFKERPEIAIDLALDEKGNVKLIISDNGVGFPDNLDFQKTESLGLQLVCALVKQLDGSIKMEKTQGTRFIICFSEKTKQQKLQKNMSKSKK